MAVLVFAILGLVLTKYDSLCVAEYYLEYVGMGFKIFLGVPKIAVGGATIFF